MAKAESGLRSRIKAALEADGWSVVTQHGSAYSPNIPDLLVVLAALEVKTETGDLRPGQRNRIRRFRREGIPAGVVRTVDDARQGMQKIRQGAYQMPGPDDLDLSYLTSLLADSGSNSTAVAEPPAAEPEQTLDNLLGMQGTYETFEPTPAAEEPEHHPDLPGTPEEYAAFQQQVANPQSRPLVDAYQSVLKQEPVPQELIERAEVVDSIIDRQPALRQARQLVDDYEKSLMSVDQFNALNAVGRPQYTLTQTGSGGLLEQIVGYLAHIDQMLSAMASGFGGGSQGAVTAAPQGEQPVRRRRRTKAEMEAAAAAGEPAEVE